MTGPRATLDPEVAHRVAGLTLRARRAAEGLLTGLHKSPHRGASVVFVEHRDYRPGDDLRLLDWRAFARTDRHSIKHFEQETQLKATLVLDRSASMDWQGPSGGPSKLDHAVTLLGALAYILVRQGDATGAAAIDTEIIEALPAKSRPAHLDAVLRTLSGRTRRGARTDLESALTSVAERSGRRGVVVVASDLLDLSPTALQPLAQLVTRGHDVLVLHVLHADEIDLPFEGPARFVGLEGEEPVEADVATIRAQYATELEAFLGEARQRCVAAGTRYALARTDEAPEHALAALLAGGRRGGWG